MEKIPTSDEVKAGGKMKLFFADTETTGLDPVKNEVFQFGCIIEVSGKIVDEMNIKLRPTDFSNVTEEALRITGKTVEELKTYPPAAEGYRSLMSTLGKHVDKYNKMDKMVWVGQNARFDIEFTRQLFKRQGDKYFGSWFESQPIDLISIARFCKIAGLINPENSQLGSICKALGVELNAHDALDDVKATREAMYKLMEFLKKPEPVVNAREVG